MRGNLSQARANKKAAPNEGDLKLMKNPASSTSVILGLDPRIHHFNDLWMVGSSPTMTK